jgi:hypothetical protein
VGFEREGKGEGEAARPSPDYQNGMSSSSEPAGE